MQAGWGPSRQEVLGRGHAPGLLPLDHGQSCCFLAGAMLLPRGTWPGSVQHRCPKGRGELGCIWSLAHNLCSQGSRFHVFC